MRERELFEKALDIPDAHARRRFLDRACRGDVRLREGVERLLQWHERAEGFLDVPAAERSALVHDDRIATKVDAAVLQDTALSAAAMGTTGGPEDPLPGDRLGAVRLLGWGFASVYGPSYVGFDESVEKPVSVRVLDRRHCEVVSARRRFVAAARQLASLRHASLPTVLRVEERPVPYLLMEPFDGEWLVERLDRSGPLPLGMVLEVGIGVAGALSAAHEVGLAHRYLSPAAVMLVDRGGFKTAVVPDMGLLHAIDQATGCAVPVPGLWPDHLAPEQARAEVIDPFDHRVDLFSFGCLLVAMAAGHSPFSSALAEGAVRRVIDHHPSMTLLLRLPAWLRSIVEALLAEDPRRRPPSAGWVAERLKAIAATEACAR